MPPLPTDVAEVLTRYDGALRTHGVRLELVGVAEGVATISVDLSSAASSCSGDCGVPLPALLLTLERDVRGVPGLADVRWRRGGEPGAPV